LALPETRASWREGISTAVREFGIDANELGIEVRKLEEGDIGDLAKLKRKDGSELSSAQVADAIHSADDLLSLIESEASGSYFNWIPCIGQVAQRMGKDEVIEFAKKLHLGRRETFGFVKLAERLLELQDLSAAWEMAVQAAERAEQISSDRFAEDGPMEAVINLLRRIDAKNARAWALESLVEHLTNGWWWPYGVALELHRIACMVCERVPTLALWQIIENYLKALFAEVSPIDPSSLLIEDDGEDTPRAALVKLTCEFLGHPAHVLSEGAIRSCVDLLLSGNSEIVAELHGILNNSDGRARDVVIVLDAVSEKDPAKAAAFREVIATLRGSPDQSIRWSAERIAARLNESPPTAREKVDVLARYQRYLIIPEPESFHGRPKETSFDILPDSVHPRELLAPWQMEVERIAKAANLAEEAVLARTVHFMRQLSAETSWNGSAERDLRQRMENAKLEFPFRRLRVSQSRQAIFCVLAELGDGGRITDATMTDLETAFRTHDTGLLLLHPMHRPQEVPSVSCPQYNEFKREWVEAVHQVGSECLCRMIGARRVLAEKSKLRPSGNGTPSEVRQSVVCSDLISCPDPRLEHERFFPTLYREVLSTYHASSPAIRDFPVIAHFGGGYETPGDGWLALNPSLGRYLGWCPARDGLLAWERDGEMMVETLWWNDGLVEQSMPYYRKSEVGEGWLVVASPQAVEQLVAHFESVKRVISVTREIIDNRRDPVSETRVWQEKIET
jgi:hypothetical protein